ncbi:hypothetical protein NMY22_g7218 [Coprinellus aureogranulatus]|nr:hypothetical protein NMY22_g7218 [Coprinellus aureogranulatus]
MCNDPEELRLLSRNFATYLPPEDLEVTSDKLIEIQSLKFRQHGNLAKLLLGTGDRFLIFCDSEDLNLGVDRDGNGKNELGRALMIVRDSLKEGVAVHERAATR